MSGPFTQDSLAAELTIIQQSKQFCLVCVPEKLTRQQVESLLTYLDPNNLRQIWVVSTGSTPDGSNNPGECVEHEEGRKHWYLTAVYLAPNYN